jgi:hypothetical protein
MAVRPVQVKSLTTRGLAGERIEAKPILPRPGGEVEHILQRTSDCVKRAFAGAAEAPVILNETQNGALVGHGVIDEVALGEGRNHQKRQTGTISAAALRGSTRCLAAGVGAS